jgi:hypothetical protein
MVRNVQSTSYYYSNTILLDNSDIPLKTQTKTGDYDFLSPMWENILQEGNIDCFI